MAVLAGPLTALAALLVASGTAKLRRPEPASVALAGARLPAARWLVRALAVAETAVGSLALLVGGRTPALLVALAYLALAAFVVLGLRRHAASCGCFGAPDTPPTSTHFALNVGAAALALGAVAAPVPGLATTLADQPLGGLPFLALAACATWFGYLMLTELPRLRVRAPFSALRR